MSVPRFERGSPSAVRQYLGAGFVVGVYALVDWREGGPSLLATVEASTRSALYISIAASGAALLGFAIAAASILAALGDGPRITWMREQPAFVQVRIVFMGAMRALAFATIYSTVLIVSDTGKCAHVLWEYVFVGSVVLSLTRMAWVLWLLDWLLHHAIHDQKQTAGAVIERPSTEPDDPE